MIQVLCLLMWKHCGSHAKSIKNSICRAVKVPIYCIPSTYTRVGISPKLNFVSYSVSYHLWHSISQLQGVNKLIKVEGSEPLAHRISNKTECVHIFNDSYFHYKSSWSYSFRYHKRSREKQDSIFDFLGSEQANLKLSN